MKNFRSLMTYNIYINTYNVLLKKQVNGFLRLSVLHGAKNLFSLKDPFVGIKFHEISKHKFPGC